MDGGYKTTGEIVHVGEAIAVTSTFTKREVALKIDGTYPQTRLFQLSQTKVDLILPSRIGQTATLHWNLNGRRVEKADKVYYFNTDDVWKVDFGGGGAAPAPAPLAAKQAEDLHPFPENGDDDGLPF